MKEILLLGCSSMFGWSEAALSAQEDAFLSTITGLGWITTADCSDTAVDCLPDDVSPTNINMIDIDNKGVGGTIPPLNGLTRIRYLYLNNNQLSGTMPGLDGMTSLIYFHFNDNLMSGTLPNLPSKVTQIRGDNNQLTGTLSIASASAFFDYISLENNAFTGTIPWLEMTTSMRHLYLSGNSFTGTLPPLTAFPNLWGLQLDGNTLGGTIPDLSSLDELNNMYLENCGLSGTIPALSSSAKLGTVHLSNNQLTGTIPVISGMYDFRASNNQLSGVLPEFLGALFWVDGNLLTTAVEAIGSQVTSSGHCYMTNNPWQLLAPHFTTAPCNLACNTAPCNLATPSPTPGTTINTDKNEFAILGSCPTALVGNAGFWGPAASLYSVLLLVSLVQFYRASVHSLCPFASNSRSLAQLQMGQLLALCGARIAQAASMAAASCPLTLAGNASVAVAAAVPLTMHVTVFALLALAWAKVAWADVGRHSGNRAIIVVAAFVLVVLCVQVALVLATTATEDRDEQQHVSRTGATLTFLVVAGEGVAFALFGRSIYISLTSKGFKSKHASVILRLSVAFLVFLFTQAALQLGAAMAPASFARWAVGMQTAHLLLDCGGIVCVLLVFRNAINTKRMRGSSGSSGAVYKTNKSSQSRSKWASRGRHAIGVRNASSTNSSWAGGSRGGSNVVPVVLELEDKC